MRASNRQLVKEIEGYSKLLETIDKEFGVVMQKENLGSLSELTESFIRAE